jgi:hypothetical protein
MTRLEGDALVTLFIDRFTICARTEAGDVNGSGNHQVATGEDVRRRQLIPGTTCQAAGSGAATQASTSGAAGRLIAAVNPGRTLG